MNMGDKNPRITRSAEKTEAKMPTGTTSRDASPRTTQKTQQEKEAVKEQVSAPSVMHVDPLERLFNKISAESDKKAEETKKMIAQLNAENEQRFNKISAESNKKAEETKKLIAQLNVDSEKRAKQLTAEITTNMESKFDQMTRQNNLLFADINKKLKKNEQLIEAKFSENKSLININANDINKLNETVTNIQSKVTTDFKLLKTEVNTNKKNTNEIKNDIKNLTEYVENNVFKMDELTQNVDTLTNDIQTNKLEIAEATLKVTNCLNKTSDMTQQVERMREDCRLKTTEIQNILQQKTSPTGKAKLTQQDRIEIVNMAMSEAQEVIRDKNEIIQIQTMQIQEIETELKSVTKKQLEQENQIKILKTDIGKRPTLSPQTVSQTLTEPSFPLPHPSGLTPLTTTPLLPPVSIQPTQRTTTDSNPTVTMPTYTQTQTPIHTSLTPPIPAMALNLENFSGHPSDNPIKFLHAVETYFSLTTTYNDKHRIAILGQAFTNSAHTWFTNNRHNFTTYENFMTAFRRRFWDSEKQQRIREQLFNGRFNPDTGIPKQEYASRLITNLQHLDVPISNSDIVYYLLRHFDNQTRLLAQIMHVSQIDELLEFLGQAHLVTPAVSNTNYKTNTQKINATATPNPSNTSQSSNNYPNFSNNNGTNNRGRNGNRNTYHNRYKNNKTSHQTGQSRTNQSPTNHSGTNQTNHDHSRTNPRQKTNQGNNNTGYYGNGQPLPPLINSDRVQSQTIYRSQNSSPYDINAIVSEVIHEEDSCQCQQPITNTQTR